MGAEATIGILIVAVALVVLVSLVIWSRWAINRIADRDLKSARDIVKDFENGA